MHTHSAVAINRSRRSWLLTFVVLCALILTICAVGIPNLLRSRIAANEASAVGSIRTIDTAVMTYRQEHPGEGYPQSLSSLTPYLDANLASGQKSGYQFRYAPQTSDADGSVNGFRVEAVPLSDQTGQRRFSSNESGTINFQADANDSERPLDGMSASSAQAMPSQPTRRTIQKGSLNLIVSDPKQAADRVRSVATSIGGYVESERYSDDGGGLGQTCIAIRIPANRFEHALHEIRALGTRVTKEEDDAREVTAQYVDLESQLRNLRAEEGQYLEIMQRSGSIKDTLAVAERLADVRGRIEHIQGQLNFMAHQTEMAMLEVNLAKEFVPQPVDLHWHPLAEVKTAFSNAADDLSTYANFMIAVLFRLPVFALWVITALLCSAGGWRLARWTRKRLFSPAATA